MPSKTVSLGEAHTLWNGGILGRALRSRAYRKRMETSDVGYQGHAI